MCLTFVHFYVKHGIALAICLSTKQLNHFLVVVRPIWYGYSKHFMVLYTNLWELFEDLFFPDVVFQQPSNISDNDKIVDLMELTDSLKGNDVMPLLSSRTIV